MQRNEKRKLPWKHTTTGSLPQPPTLRLLQRMMMMAFRSLPVRKRGVVATFLVLTIIQSSLSSPYMVTTAWQHSTVPSYSSFRRHRSLGDRRSKSDIATLLVGHGGDNNCRMTSLLSMTANEVTDENENSAIIATTSVNDNNIENSEPDTNTNIMIPANLRRKIQAKRPTLGHVVPYKYKQSQLASAAPTTTSGGSIPSQLRLQGRRDKVDHINTNNNNYLIKIMAGMARGRKLESPSTVYLRPMMGKVKEAIYSTLTSFGIYSDSQSRNSHYHSIRHLDIFAGSGSVGLESLSRGSTHCTFVDFSMDCCTCIQRNIDLTGLGTTTTSSRRSPSNDDTSNTKSTLVCCTDAMTALTDPYSVGILSSPQHGTTTGSSPYQIITICPPYEEVVYGDLLEAVVGSDTVTEDTIVIIEYPIELLQAPKQKTPNPSRPKDRNHYGMPHVIQSKSNTAIGIRNRKYGRTVIAFYIINPTGRYPDANSRPEEFVHPV